MSDEMEQIKNDIERILKITKCLAEGMDYQIKLNEITTKQIDSLVAQQSEDRWAKIQRRMLEEQK